LDSQPISLLLEAFFLSEYIFNLSTKGWNDILHNGSDGSKVNANVVMDQFVPHAGNLLLFNCCMLGARIIV
jgi:hypothetical protein